jgi:hypothetical protein
MSTNKTASMLFPKIFKEMLHKARIFQIRANRVALNLVLVSHVTPEKRGGTSLFWQIEHCQRVITQQAIFVKGLLAKLHQIQV